MAINHYEPSTKPLNILSWRSKSPIFAALLCLMLLFLYYPTIKWLIWLWKHDKAYSHGFLIPFISLFLVWLKRDQLRKIEIRPAYFSGGIFILTGGAFLVVGRVGAIAQVEAVSLMIMLPGIVLFVWGWKFLRALALPLFYLQFMIPWTEPIIDKIHMPFQIISAEIGGWILELAGIPVHLNWIYIQLPNITLKVAKECSGIKFLISIVAIAVPLVYLTQRSWKRALVVLFASLAITVVTNSVRVALAGFMGNNYGPELLHGPGHIFRGWFVAQVGVMILFLFNWAIARMPYQTELRLWERWKTKFPPTPYSGPKKAFARPVALVLIFLAVIGVYIYGFAIPRPVNARQDLTAFPNKIGKWRGAKSAWLKGSCFFLNPDKTLRKSYKDPSGREVNLYVGYYASQRQDKRIVSLYDKPLHAKAGVVNTGIGKRGPREVKHALVPIGGKPYEVVFWYDFPSGNLTGRLKNKLKTITDALLYRRNNGAVVLLAADPPELFQPDVISQGLMDFLVAVSPILDEYLP